MPTKSRKTLKSKGGAAPKKRSRKVVNFDLSPEELARVEADLKVASDAGGVPITLAAFARSAALEYGRHRRQLADIKHAIDTDERTSPESDSFLVGRLRVILEGA